MDARSRDQTQYDTDTQTHTQTHTHPDSAPQTAARQGIGEGKRILLVDDSRTIRESARSLLEDCGCHLTLAENGFEALCQVAAVRPHLVFMDISMPELDGFQACALIRASVLHGATPVVLVSANDGRVDRARAELVGAQRYILKPFRKADLLAAIHDLLLVDAPEDVQEDRDGPRAAD